MRFLLFTASFALLYTGLLAQPNQIRFNHMGIEDGLSQATAYAIAQDTTGIIWIGTRDGLNRYDASGIQIFRPQSNKDSTLSNTTVRALLADDHGGIWIGTDGGGLNYYSDQDGAFVHYKHDPDNVNSISSNRVLSLEADGPDYIWVGTRGNGVNKFHVQTGRVDRFLSNTIVWDIHRNKQGDVLFATDQGLFIKKGSDFLHLLKDLQVKVVHSTSEGMVWVGTEGAGVYLFDSSYKILPANARPLTNRSINAITEDSEGRIWIGTDQNGLFYIDESSGNTVNVRASSSNPYSISENAIRSLFVDKVGMIWVGTNTSGIDTYSRYRFKFEHYKRYESDASISSGNVVLGFEELDDRFMIMGTERTGLYTFDRETRSFAKFEPFSSELYDELTIPSLLKTRDGTLWIATDGEGLFHTAGNILNEKITSSNGLTNNSVLVLYEDPHDNYLWAGTYNGLNKIDVNGRIIATYSTEVAPELKDDRILSLIKVTPDKLWIGTQALGIFELNTRTDQIKHIEATASQVQALYIDEEGYIWVGSYSGLVKMSANGDELRSYRVQDGLPNDVVYGILEDEEHNLWLSTNSGISKFNHTSEDFDNYSIADGLQSNEFNGGAYSQTRNGEMYFGGVNGFNIINPEQVPASEHISKTIITGFNLAGESLPGGFSSAEPIQLSYNENFFSFTYTLLDYVAPEEVSFRYMLDDLDKNWVYTGNNRRANYTSVPPGTYTFRVQGISSDGVEGLISKPMIIQIAAPFWQTGWFIISSLLIVGGIVYGAYRYRLYHLLKRQQIRDKIAHDLHDEVSATLSSISYFAEAVERQSGISNRFISLITDSANDAKEKITDIIWAINPEHDDWESLLAKCRRFASDLLESKGVKYHIEIDEQVPGKPEMETRQHFWLIYKEVLTNAVRHSGATQVNVSIKYDGRMLQMVVQDNGQGFDIEEDKNGNGLKNITKRAHAMNGTAELSSDKEFGTRWKVHLQL